MNNSMNYLYKLWRMKVFHNRARLRWKNLQMLINVTVGVFMSGFLRLTEVDSGKKRDDT